MNPMKKAIASVPNATRDELVEAAVALLVAIARTDEKVLAKDPFKVLDDLNALAQDALTVTMMTHPKKDEGWRDWDGKGTPPTGRVDVLLRGDFERYYTEDASHWNWDVVLGRNYDIVAWRPAR
jgi:hypothetical protein